MDDDRINNLDEERLLKIFRKHHIQERTWHTIKAEYLNWRPPFESALVNNYNDEQFIVTTNQFFNFKKSFTVKSRKSEFNKWLKEYWEFFISDSFKQVCEKIFQAIHDYNEENPDFAVPFINWIPNYGGLLCEPAQFPHELEQRYKDAHRIPFVAPLPIDEPPALVHRLRNPVPEEIDYIHPEDIPDN
jgi:hypothetical protein